MVPARAPQPITAPVIRSLGALLPSPPSTLPDTT
jgi:hypothetical protein